MLDSRGQDYAYSIFSIRGAAIGRAQNGSQL